MKAHNPRPYAHSLPLLQCYTFLFRLSLASAPAFLAELSFCIHVCAFFLLCTCAMRWSTWGV